MHLVPKRRLKRRRGTKKSKERDNRTEASARALTPANGMKKKGGEKDTDIIGCTCSPKLRLTLSYNNLTATRLEPQVPNPHKGKTRPENWESGN